MADEFPASINVPDEAFRAVLARMRLLKAHCIRRRDEAAAGNIPATTIIDDLFVRLRLDHVALTAAKDVPGIGAYAQGQFDDPTFDFAASFNGVLSTIDGVLAWISTNFPKDANGWLLARTIGAEGPVDRQFTPAQTATLRTQLDNLIARIT